MNHKKYYYDKEADSLFIVVREGEEEKFEEIVPGIHIELDKNNDIIGVEILKASRFLNIKKKEMLLAE